MICYLDVDGVLANFQKGVARTFGITEEKLTELSKPGEWHIEKSLGITIDEFWSKIDKCGVSFWTDLEVMSDAHRILKYCEWKYDRVVLVTSPSRNPLASAGKVAWIQTNLPKYAFKYAITPCKDAFAHSNAVLIDDSDEGVDKFINAGGHGFVFPRRWNSKHKFCNNDFRLYIGGVD